MKPLGTGNFAGMVGLVAGWAGAGFFDARSWSLQLIDPLNRQAVAPPLRDLGGIISSLHFSPDGQRIFVAGGDGAVRVFAVPVGSEVGDGFPAMGQTIAAVVFDDGRQLVTRAGSGEAVLWDVDADSWRRKACAIAGRNLTRAEWDKYLAHTGP